MKKSESIYIIFPLSSKEDMSKHIQRQLHVGCCDTDAHSRLIKMCREEFRHILPALQTISGLKHMQVKPIKVIFIGLDPSLPTRGKTEPPHSAVHTQLRAVILFYLGRDIALLLFQRAA